MDIPETLFEKVIGHPRPIWLTVIVAVILLGVPFLVGSIWYGVRELFEGGYWRGLFTGPIIIIYILAVTPKLVQMEKKVSKEFLPIVMLSDEELSALLQKSGKIEVRTELIAIGLGAIFGTGLVIFQGNFTISLISILIVLLSALTYSLVIWIIFVSIAGGNLITSLLRQPLRLNLFDISPFEVIGRQSLIQALVFVGGVMIGLVVIIFTPGAFLHPGFWLFYIPFLIIPVFIFFINMYPAHRLLAFEKERELRNVRSYFHPLKQSLVEGIKQNKDTEKISSEIIALTNYEQRLQEVRTWPYNTAMLRALVFSVLLPGAATYLVRIFLEHLFG